MSNYSFNNSFCQKIIVYLESLYLNLKQSSSNKNVMSKNISKFARPVFLRPVFRPTPVKMLFLDQAMILRF
jgi:hypothetical protein